MVWGCDRSPVWGMSSSSSATFPGSNQGGHRTLGPELQHMHGTHREAQKEGLGGFLPAKGRILSDLGHLGDIP